MRAHLYLINSTTPKAKLPESSSAPSMEYWIDQTKGTTLPPTFYLLFYCFFRYDKAEDRIKANKKNTGTCFYCNVFLQLKTKKSFSYIKSGLLFQKIYVWNSKLGKVNYNLIYATDFSLDSTAKLFLPFSINILIITSCSIASSLDLWLQ